MPSEAAIVASCSAGRATEVQEVHKREIEIEKSQRLVGELSEA